MNNLQIYWRDVVCYNCGYLQQFAIPKGKTISDWLWDNRYENENKKCFKCECKLNIK